MSMDHAKHKETKGSASAGLSSAAVVLLLVYYYDLTCKL